MHVCVWNLSGGRWSSEVPDREFEMGYAIASQVPDLEAVLPPKVDVHWETDNRVVWNEMECAAQEQELIYEVTWIPEIGAWRRFLKSRRNVER
jgi:hypothetical protein